MWSILARNGRLVQSTVVRERGPYRTPTTSTRSGGKQGYGPLKDAESRIHDETNMIWVHVEVYVDEVNSVGQPELKTLQGNTTCTLFYRHSIA